MNDAHLENELRRLLAERTAVAAADVRLDDDLQYELHLDSLAALKLLALVEKHFDVRFPDEQLSEFRTLRQLLAFLALHAREKST